MWELGSASGTVRGGTLPDVSPRATAGPLTARLLGPAGFVLAGLCVFLPFGTVSCAVASGKHGALAYTGAQLIRHAGGTISMTPRLRDELGQTAAQLPASTGTTVLGQAHIGGLRILLVAALATMLVGVVATVIRSRAARCVVALGAALAALIMLVGAQIAGRHAAEDWFVGHPVFGPAGGGLPAGVSIRPGLGFWLSAGLLIVVGAGYVLALLRTSDEPTPDAEPPRPGEAAGPTDAPNPRPKPRMRA
jgi:hypothetical protein